MYSLRHNQIFFSGWWFFSVCVGWGLLSIAGCSKGQVKLTETEQQIGRVDSFLSGLEEVYGKKDLSTLKSYFSPKFQEQHPEVFTAVQEVFEKVDQIQMDLTVDLIQINKEKVKVLLHWNVNSQSAQGILQNRGNTTLQLTEDTALQIVAVEGDNLFTLTVASTD
jgi:hypothetical protein